MVYRALLLLSALGSVACAPSIASLADRGQFHEACEATDFGYSSELVDRLAAKSGARVRITPWTTAEALREARVTTPPHQSGWLGLALELTHGEKASPLAEISVAAPQVRAPGWQSRGELGLGDSYQLLTGRVIAPQGTQATLGDIAGWARDAVLTGSSEARGKLAGVLTANDLPEDIVGAQSLSSLFARECRSTPGETCRTAALVSKGESRPSKPAAVGLTLRYAVADPATGAHCMQVEHVVVPLAEAPDLPGRLARTFAGAETTLVELRNRSRVYGMEGESPFHEDGF